jgi:uncharacterized protein
MVLRIVAGFTCFLAMPVLAQTGPRASFDCAKAATPVERAICDGAAELDGIMAELYRVARAIPARQAAVDADQRRWLEARNSRCGRAKPDTECLARLYKDRIVELARAAGAGGSRGAFITGRYAYRQKGEAGELFLAELADGAAYVQVETVNTEHPSPHSCSFSARLRERRGDVLTFRDPEGSKTCRIEISVMGNSAVLREAPKDCYDLARYYCGAHGYMLGTYVRR